MRSKFCLVLAILSSLLLTACASASEETIASVNEIEINLPVELALYDEFTLLDSNDNYLLFTHNIAYDLDTVQALMQTAVYKGNSFYIYDIQSDEFTEEISIDEEKWCVDAILLDDSLMCIFFCFDEIKLETSFTCEMYSKGQWAEIYFGACSPVTPYRPEIEKLADGAVFTYGYMPLEDEIIDIGINYVSADGEISNILEYQSDSTNYTFLSNELVGDGNTCAYYVAIDNLAYFEVVSAGGSILEVAFPTEYLLYNYALIGDKILLSAQKKSEDSTQEISQYLVLINFNGEILDEIDCDVIYNLVPNYENFVLGQNRQAEVYSINIENDEIEIESLDFIYEGFEIFSVENSFYILADF